MHERWTRRGVVAAGMAAGTSAMIGATPRGAPPAARLIAGTYARGGGEGLYPIVRDARSGRWSVAAPVRGIDNASFGIVDGAAGPSYLLDERADGRVAAYDRGWTRRGAVVGSGGADPCHAALDHRSGCLAIANYSSGSVGFFALDRRGGGLPPATVYRHSGGGPDRARQTTPHAHWVGFSPDRRWLHAVDLGADAIFAYRFDPAARSLAEPVVAWRATPGAGPRHLAWHPSGRFAYVVCELDNRLVTLRASSDGGFATVASVSTLPEGFDGRSQAAHIALDGRGRQLYLSNRGHDSIAVFALDTPAQPVAMQHLPSGGRWPRFFLLREDAGEMFVGNERSGEVAVLRVAPDGTLAPAGHALRVPGVVFLAAA